MNGQLDGAGSAPAAAPVPAPSAAAAAAASRLKTNQVRMSNIRSMTWSVAGASDGFGHSGGARHCKQVVALVSVSLYGAVTLGSQFADFNEHIAF